MLQLIHLQIWLKVMMTNKNPIFNELFRSLIIFRILNPFVCMTSRDNVQKILEKIETTFPTQN